MDANASSPHAWRWARICWLCSLMMMVTRSWIWYVRFSGGRTDTLLSGWINVTLAVPTLPLALVMLLVMIVHVVIAALFGYLWIL